MRRGWNTTKGARQWLLTAFCAASCVFSGSAQAQVEPDRHGFTLELAAGPGYRHDFLANGVVIGTFQLQHLSASIGWFVSPAVALQARLSLTATVGPGEGASGHDEISPLYQHLVGCDVQTWLTDRWFIAAGVGGSMIFVENNRNDWGLGLSLRGGFSFATWLHHSLRFTLDLIGGVYGSRTTLVEALCLEWQWF